MKTITTITLDIEVKKKVLPIIKKKGSSLSAEIDKMCRRIIKGEEKNG